MIDGVFGVEFIIDVDDMFDDVIEFINLFGVGVVVLKFFDGIGYWFILMSEVDGEDGNFFFDMINLLFNFFIFI